MVFFFMMMVVFVVVVDDDDDILVIDELHASFIHDHACIYFRIRYAFGPEMSYFREGL